MERDGIFGLKSAFFASALFLTACAREPSSQTGEAGQAGSTQTLASLVISSIPASEAGAGEAKSAAELEKEKALKNPYPNDLGPEKIDEEVKTYPAEAQAGYKLMLARCAQCHTSARPLNSRFAEPEGKDDPAKEAAVAGLKKSNPEFFKDGGVWQVEAAVWKRYVKRMMAKPGCKIEKDEGKKIWQFLVADSAKRKLGANAKKWEAHRRKLLSEFRQKYPERYKELEQAKDL